jgi:hypothetical protein
MQASTVAKRFRVRFGKLTYMKLGRRFYLRPALTVAPDLLGKRLVYKTEQGPISGIISDVEAYPALVGSLYPYRFYI